MNKDLLNSLPAEDQPAASKLNSFVDQLQLSQDFQWELETRLMDAAQKKTKSASGWQAKILPALAWTALAVGAVLILSWTIRSLTSPAPAAVVTPEPLPSFEENVRQGKICTGPLAVGHGFAVFLTNGDKTELISLDQERSIGEMRSFTWSTDGSQLAIFGNTTGHGNIYLTESTGSPARPVLSNSEMGYLLDGAWSRDGSQFVLWSSQNNQMIYLVSPDGSNLVEKQMELRILGTPQFAPDGKSIVFYGVDQNAVGLFEMQLDHSLITLINPSVKDPGGYAFSPDGSLLAYMEYDRDKGEARLFTANRATDERTLLGTMPIPATPGASLPDSANLSWSQDGKFLVFDFGQYASERSIYLAPVDGTGLRKVIDSGYAPSLSADGKCLAYIYNKQVFILKLENTSTTISPVPVLLAKLPAGRATSDARLDKLQWQP